MPSGPRNGNWNADRIVSSHGYLKERVGVGHPLADSKGYAYVHQLTWAASGRRMPRAHETLHHANGHKTDNRLQNLQVITRVAHAKLHARTRTRRTNGTFAKEAAHAA